MNPQPNSKLIEAVIAEFDPAKIDFGAISRNILWYASINLANGRLRPGSPPSLPPGPDGPVNPSAAEEEDRQRQLQAAPPGQVPPDPEAVARLTSLNDLGRYGPFNFKQNVFNQIRAIAAISGHMPVVATFKQNYIASLNGIQNTSIPCSDEVIASYDNSDLLQELCREGLITQTSAQIFSPYEQERITHGIVDAFSFIKAVDENLHAAICSMIGSIACIRREGSSGTVSSMIGLLWLNPTPAWTILDFAENIVHEFVHNTIFLSDLVDRIFTTPHWYTTPDSLVTSAIKKYPRGVNISYHSALVAIGLIIFMAKAKQLARAEELTAGLRATILGLKEKSSSYLSNHGRHNLDLVDIYDDASAVIC
jgi:hypothetical protein